MINKKVDFLSLSTFLKKKLPDQLKRDSNMSQILTLPV